MEERVRKVDLEKLSEEEADQLSQRIGEKLRQIMDKACDEANRIAQIYGIQVKMQFLIEPLNQTENPKGE